MFLSKYTFNLKTLVLTHTITESILKMYKQQMITEKKKSVTSKTCETQHLTIVQTLVQL